MLRISLKFILLITFLTGITSIVNSQLLYPPDHSIPLKQRDTICFQYDFQKGDTLIYEVFAYDSISINYESALFRIRQELLRVICEDIDAQNRFLLSLTLINYKAIETQGENKNIQITDSPWLNRKTFIVIDSLGDRYYSKRNDTTNYAMSPGGGFQPILFFPILRKCKEVNSTWIVQSTDTLVENGLPVPLMKQFSLIRLHPLTDTLGHECTKIEYVKTGQGALLSSKAGAKMNISNVINSFGELFISTTEKKPIFLFASVEQKLTIHLAEGKTQPGIHRNTSYYTLKQIIKPNKIINKRKKK